MLSQAGKDALGYTGGGLLAVCLIPQIAKLLITRSARDISLAWTLLYLSGTALTMVYLIFEGAMAAWIPLVIETAACLLTLILKLLFDHTKLGRRLPVGMEVKLDASIHSCPGISHVAVIPSEALQSIADWSKHGREASGYGSRNASQHGSLDHSFSSNGGNRQRVYHQGNHHHQQQQQGQHVALAAGNLGSRGTCLELNSQHARSGSLNERQTTCAIAPTGADAVILVAGSNLQ